MPINSTMFITGSVGAGGKNQKQDVMAVQQRLNDLMHPPRVPLAVDGKVGSKTIRMIRDFQKGAAGFSRGDGRVDPNAKTIVALNDPASEGRWAKMSIPPIDDLQPKKGKGAALNDKEKDGHEKVHTAIANATGDQAWTNAMLDQLIKDYGPAVKGFFATFGVAADASKIAHGIKVLKDVGLNAQQTAKVIGILLSKESAPISVALLKAIGEQSGRVTLALKKLGKPLIVVSVVICAVDCYNYFQKGEYGAAAGEIYKLGMGIAVPWAALVDAVQTIIEAIAPSMAGNTYFNATFKLIRTLNPLAAGAVAVDTVVTLVQTAINGYRTGKLSTRDLDKLVTRMKSGPLQVFAEAGEWWGDQAYNFYEWLSK